jgi:hypothetical protein
MSTLLVYGFLTTINGVAEQHFVVPLDGDGRGIEQPAALQRGAFTLKVGLNTYAGALHAATLGNGLDEESTAAAAQSGAAAAAAPSALVVPGARWCGNFFHDEYGGVDGDIPRGSFWLRVSRLPSRLAPAQVRLVSFDGSTTSSVAVGRPLKLLVGFDRTTRQPVSHGGAFTAEGNDLCLVEVTAEVDVGGATRLTTLTTRYVGKWARTQQNEKFCGTFTTSRQRDEAATVVSDVVDSGSFFCVASEVTEWGE